jgi:hypothetical protein
MVATAPADMTHAELAQHATEVAAASRNLYLLSLAQQLCWRYTEGGPRADALVRVILDELEDA